MTDSQLWHPFADMAPSAAPSWCSTAARTSGSGTTDGNRYLDATASLWYANVGHGRSRDRRRGRRADGTLEAYSIVRRLRDRARRSSSPTGSPQLAPMEDAKVFLAAGGGDAIDTAAKLARRYWQALGAAASALHLISRTHALPRHPRVRDEHRRHRGEPRRLRPARPATRSVPHDDVARAERRDRAHRAGAHRRVLLRAGDRRGRRLPAGARLHRGACAELCARGRRAVRRRLASSAASAGWARGSASSGWASSPT